MHNQSPAIERIDLSNSFNVPSEDPNSPGKSRMHQSYLPPYSNTRYLPPGSYPIPYGHPSQQYGAPGGPRVLYYQEPYPVLSEYPPDPHRVTIQPTAFVTPMPQDSPVPDYMCYSVCTLLCCCLPLGICAVIYSASTRDANISGPRVLAERSSRTALNLNNAALGIGITMYGLAIIFMFLIFSNVLY